MIENRDAAISETLKWEGGYSNIPADPGGPTNWGITIADARKYWKAGATAADVKAMPKSVAIDIYRNKYWKTPYYDCDKLALGVDLVVFDYGVNSGPSRAKKALDAAIGGSDVQTINKICDQRLAFVKSLRTWPTFGKGWSSRIAGIRAKALQMAQTPKPVSKVPAGTATATIVVGGAAAAAAEWNLWHLWPWALAIAAFVALTIFFIKEYKHVGTS